MHRFTSSNEHFANHLGPFYQFQSTSGNIPAVRPYFNLHITLARKMVVLCASFHHLYSTTSLSQDPDMSNSVCRQPKMRRFQRSQVTVSLRREGPCLNSLKLIKSRKMLEKMVVGRLSFPAVFWWDSILSGPKCSC